jgi:hypothetical protein
MFARRTSVLLRRLINNDKEIGKRGYIVKRSEWEDYNNHIIKSYACSQQSFEHKASYNCLVKSEPPTIDYNVKTQDINVLKSKNEHLLNALMRKTIELEKSRQQIVYLESKICNNKNKKCK